MPAAPADIGRQAPLAEHGVAGDDAVQQREVGQQRGGSGVLVLFAADGSQAQQGAVRVAREFEHVQRGGRRGGAAECLAVEGHGLQHHGGSIGLLDAVDQFTEAVQADPTERALQGAFAGHATAVQWQVQPEQFVMGGGPLGHGAGLVMPGQQGRDEGGQDHPPGIAHAPRVAGVGQLLQQLEHALERGRLGLVHEVLALLSKDLDLWTLTLIPPWERDVTPFRSPAMLPSTPIPQDKQGRRHVTITTRDRPTPAHRCAAA